MAICLSNSFIGVGWGGSFLHWPTFNLSPCLTAEIAFAVGQNPGLALDLTETSRDSLLPSTPGQLCFALSRVQQCTPTFCPQAGQCISGGWKILHGGLLLTPCAALLCALPFSYPGTNVQLYTWACWMTISMPEVPDETSCSLERLPSYLKLSSRPTLCFPEGNMLLPPSLLVEGQGREGSQSSMTTIVSHHPIQYLHVACPYCYRRKYFYASFSL